MEAPINNKLQRLVSICMPAYNAETYIAETLDSLLAQTHQHLEIIIVDDHSTDRTMEIINRYMQKHPAIRCYKNNGRGAAAARNMAFTKSKGALIKFFDADDLLNPEAIEQQAILLSDNPGCIISCKWGRFRNDLSSFKIAEEPLWHDMKGTEWLTRSWKKASGMTQPGIFLLPRNLILRIGLWDESLSLNDDMEFYTKMILNAEQVLFCQTALLYYRSGIEGSLSVQKSEKAYLSSLSAITQSTDRLLKKEDQPHTRKVAAALFQGLAFSVYPQYPEIYKKARQEVARLGGSNLNFPAGGYTKILTSVIGWKATKRLKNLLDG